MIIMIYMIIKSFDEYLMLELLSYCFSKAKYFRICWKMADIKKKCILVGDGACGKTCLFTVFSKDEFPESDENSMLEKYVTDYEVDGKQVRDPGYSFVIKLA